MTTVIHIFHVFTDYGSFGEGRWRARSQVFRTVSRASALEEIRANTLFGDANVAQRAAELAGSRTFVARTEIHERRRCREPACGGALQRPPRGTRGRRS